jgi:hypothetical protein
MCFIKNEIMGKKTLQKPKTKNQKQIQREKEKKKSEEKGNAPFHPPSILCSPATPCRST